MSKEEIRLEKLRNSQKRYYNKIREQKIESVRERQKEKEKEDAIIIQQNEKYIERLVRKNNKIIEKINLLLNELELKNKELEDLNKEYERRRESRRSSET